MNRARPDNCHSVPRGFTLIEMLVAILIISILATLFVQVMGTALSDSATPVTREQIGLERNGIMEKIISDYVREMNSDPDNALSAIKTTHYATTHVGFTAQYINFTTAGAEMISASTTNNLKVTVTGNGQAITTVLTRSRNATDATISY
jgi:prepilin-type N-terminal cleavage/methylation domain-containing protein